MCSTGILLQCGSFLGWIPSCKGCEVEVFPCYRGWSYGVGRGLKEREQRVKYLSFYRPRFVVALVDNVVLLH